MVSRNKRTNRLPSTRTHTNRWFGRANDPYITRFLGRYGYGV